MANYSVPVTVGNITVDCTGEQCFLFQALTAYNDVPLSYGVPINGYISPAIIIFAFLTNSLVCLTLLKPNMRSPTNTLLFLMAISDTLTGLCPLPFYLYIYTAGNYNDYIDITWCHLQNILVRALPTIFHTVSIWLTTTLAVQRYVYVCHNLAARKWCTIRNVIKASSCILLISFAVHVMMFFDQVYSPVELKSMVLPNTTVTGCTVSAPVWLQSTTISDPFYNVYFWVRVFFMHFIPSVVLVVINSLLIHTMRSARKRRQQLLRQNRKSESRKVKDSNCTTMMMIVVVGIFLVVELPSGVLFVIFIIDNTWLHGLLANDFTGILSLIFNLLILISYPMNFFIYAGMSRQFRETFKRIFCIGSLPVDREHSNYTALAAENGRAGDTHTTAI